jgi:hypothetical protein
MLARGVTLTTLASPGVLLRMYDAYLHRREAYLAEREQRWLEKRLADLGMNESSKVPRSNTEKP